MKQVEEQISLIHTKSTSKHPTDMIRQLEQMTMFSLKFRKFGLIKHKIQKIYFTENLSIF